LEKGVDVNRTPDVKNDGCGRFCYQFSWTQIWIRLPTYGNLWLQVYITGERWTPLVWQLPNCSKSEQNLTVLVALPSIMQPVATAQAYDTLLTTP
jgi:hypothetical protein